MNYHATRLNDGLKRFVPLYNRLCGPPAASALEMQEGRTVSLVPRTQDLAINNGHLRS